jgi:hypothetical protein
MKPQPHLFDKTETVTRVLSTGSTVTLTLEPLGEGQVRILTYYRKPARGDRFVRAPGEEGQVVAFEKLGLELSYETLFGENNGQKVSPNDHGG